MVISLKLITVQDWYWYGICSLLNGYFKKMNRMISYALLPLLGIFASMAIWAECTHYEMRVDGLACPYCAYGIEKKLTAIDGVQNIDVDLDKGLVSVDVSDGVVLTEADMKQLFNDAGFTYRSMVSSQPDHDQNQSQ